MTTHAPQFRAIRKATRIYDAARMSAIGGRHTPHRESPIESSENVMSKGMNQKKSEKKKPEKTMKEKKAEKNAKKAAKR